MNARRNDRSSLDDLFEMLVEVPAWAGPVVACIVFAGLRWWIPWQFQPADPKDLAGKVLSTTFGQLSYAGAPWGALVVLMIWVFAELRKWSDRKNRCDGEVKTDPRPQSLARRGRGKTVENRAAAPPPLPSPPPPPVPSCPACSSPMVMRTAKRGPNPGSQFWGCSQYPECRETREA